MAGLSAEMSAAAANLQSVETAGAVQVMALKQAMEQAESEVLPLLTGLGDHIDALR